MFSSAAIELRNVSLSFGEQVVISQVSFRLESGNTLFLLGPNGSGKSVLLKLIIGLLKPDSGEILIDGQDIVPLSEEQLSPLRRCMGMVFQETALFDSLSIYENVAYELREAGMRDEAEIEKRVREAQGSLRNRERVGASEPEWRAGAYLRFPDFNHNAGTQTSLENNPISRSA